MVPTTTTKAPKAPRAAPGEPAPVAPGGLYGLREVAKLLRLDRSGKLRAAIDAGLVKAVKVGGVERVSGTEILRIHREGLPALPGGRRPPPARKAKRRRAPKSTSAAGSIEEIPLD
jgi:hypothetical protein